jgi:hypothetical protein
LAVVGAAVTLVVGCAAAVTQGYEGPLRPENEVALLKTEDTRIGGFDGRRSVFAARGGRTWEILPGAHSVAAEVFVFEGAPDMPEARRSEVFVMCFEALATHTYVVRPVPDGTLTRPEVFDETTKVVVSRPCPPRSEQ